MADTQEEIIRELTDHLVDVHEALRGLEEVSDYPETVSVMRDVIHQISDLFNTPHEDLGGARQTLVNSLVDLAHQVKGDGISY